MGASTGTATWLYATGTIRYAGWDGSREAMPWRDAAGFITAFPVAGWSTVPPPFSESTRTEAAVSTLKLLGKLRFGYRTGYGISLYNCLPCCFNWFRVKYHSGNWLIRVCISNEWFCSCISHCYPSYLCLDSGNSIHRVWIRIINSLWDCHFNRHWIYLSCTCLWLHMGEADMLLNNKERWPHT